MLQQIPRPISETFPNLLFTKWLYVNFDHGITLRPKKYFWLRILINSNRTYLIYLEVLTVFGEKREEQAQHIAISVYSMASYLYLVYIFITVLKATEVSRSIIIACS